LTAALWGCALVALPPVLDILPPLFLIGVVHLIAALLLLPLAASLARDAAWLMPLAAIVAGTVLVPIIHGGGWTSPGDPVAAVEIAVVATIVAGLAFLGEGVGLATLAGLALGYAGLMLFVAAAAGSGFGPPVFAAGAAIAWALVQAAIRALGRLDGISLAAWLAVYVAIFVFGASYFLEAGQIESLQTLMPVDWIRVGVIAVGAVAIGQSLWFGRLARQTVGSLTPAILAVPVAAGLAAALEAGETPTTPALIGAVLAVAGILIAGRERPIILPVSDHPRYPMSLDDARAVAFAYRDVWQAGRDRRAALSASVMVYRIRYPDVPERDARAFIRDLIQRASG